MLGIWVVGGLGTLLANEIEDFVLAFTRVAGVLGEPYRENDSQVAPLSMQFLLNIVIECICKSMHELSTRSNDIGIEGGGGFGSLVLRLFLLLLDLAVPPGTLLVHFRPGSHSINGQIDQLPRADYGAQRVHVLADGSKHIGLRQLLS